MSLFVNANALRLWAERIGARFKLPHVIRRLATATVKSLQELDFPADESTGRPGFDGTIRCVEGNAWVPNGHSCWEMGAGNDPKAKANEDFAKRTASTPDGVQAQSTFVFVTPRHWKEKDQWIKDQTGVGKWKEVRAYDCDDLEQWFEVAPAVATWFATHITGNRPAGVDDVESHWEAISQLAEHPLPTAIFLCGRQRNIENLREWLSGPAGVLTMKSRSPAEIIDFFVAYIASLEESERTAMASHAVIVQDISAWRTLRDSTVPLVLVVDHSLPLAPEELARARRKGHHVLLALEPPLHERAPSEELVRPKQHDLAEKLEEAGFTAAMARQAARASGGSLSILKRQLSLHPSVSRNKWSEIAGSDVIATCLLLGGWSSRTSSDVAAFELLAGKPFHECERDLNALATCRDPMLLNAAGNWRVISKEDAWSSAADTVTSRMIQAFEGLATAVLLDDNPRFKLQEDQRAFARIHGHFPEFSATLKQHIGETLAFLGSHADGLNVPALTGVTHIIDSIVGEALPTGTAWERWASLGSTLQLLAEASPDAFIAALRANILASDRDFKELMADEGSPLFGRCNHAGLLWALETLEPTDKTFS